MVACNQQTTPDRLAVAISPGSCVATRHQKSGKSIKFPNICAIICASGGEPSFDKRTDQSRF